MKRRGLAGHKSGARMLGLAVLAFAAAFLTPSLHADNAAPVGQAVRLSSVDGQVRIAQGGQVLADPALMNTPLFEGTQILTSDDGRAELQFDDGSVVRISPNSSLTLAALGSQGGNTEIVLDGGLAYFELQGGNAGKSIRVRFGDSVATAAGPAVLRINLDNPPGALAVFSGAVHLERGSALALDLHGGESVTLSGGDPAQYSLAGSIEPDSWDAWNSDRDQILESAAAARTGAASNLPDGNNPAWNDLDANGNWYNVPDQGPVWSPFDAANPGWDPYGNGYWMWTPRFGYMWVSGDPWGYMPFQCGAWNFYNDFGWGWAPGGCNPWWGSGIWISNIGIAPFGYRFPLRPHPILPRGPVGRPIPGGLRAVSNPVVPVNHRPVSGTVGYPVRSRNDVVTIGGHAVQPMQAIAQRPQYDRPSSGFTGTDARARMPIYTPAPARPMSGSQHPAPASRPAPASHSAPAASHSSGGGGSHSSGGGGGSSSHR